MNANFPCKFGEFVPVKKETGAMGYKLFQGFSVKNNNSIYYELVDVKSKEKIFVLSTGGVVNNFSTLRIYFPTYFEKATYGDDKEKGRLNLCSVSYDLDTKRLKYLCSKENSAQIKIYDLPKFDKFFKFILPDDYEFRQSNQIKLEM